MSRRTELVCILCDRDAIGGGDYCLRHLEDDARRTVEFVKGELSELASIVDVAGHLIDAGLLADIEALTGLPAEVRS